MWVRSGDDRMSDEASAVEFSGIITKAGESCSRLKQGDHVWGCVTTSVYQTYFRLKEYLCQSVPSTITLEEAGTWGTTLSTAYAALVDKAQLQHGQTILIQAAASAIGQYAVQLALQLGAKVLATVSSEEQRGEIESLGVSPESILNSKDPDLAAAISGITHGKGLGVILNQSSTGKTLQCLWTSIAASGILIDINHAPTTSEGEPELSIAPLRRGASYTVFDIGKILQEEPLQMAKLLDKVSKLIPNEKFRQPSPRTTWQAGQAADAVKCARSQANHGIVVLSFDLEDRIPVTPEVANPLTLNANGTYLLVGGTGGLGANLAMFLAQKGARYLAVVSRSGPASKNAESFTQSLASIGVNVKLYAADVSEEAAMQQVLDQCAAEMPPVRGVIQCAAVLDDSIYNNMTHEQWRNATRPKINGSWILHQLLPRDLQFFVMLSSIAGVVGNRSQANYAAGNTYQDALAYYRRSQGLPAVSVDLGLMLGIGLIAERGGATNLKKWEAVGIHEEEFHLLITAAITGSWNSFPLPTQVISGLPTGGILELEGLERPFYFDDRRFAYLKKTGLDLNKDRQEANKQAALSSQLAKVESMREAIELIMGGLSQRLARELQTAAENIDHSRPLHSYGVDSLMAVDIRTWILADLQAEMSLFDVLGSSSIHALATRIAAISKAVPGGVQQQ
jgi:NADPH:quinone reductase-like Zn-dependent oxidoreductase